jgi:hypothetical protein
VVLSIENHCCLEQQKVLAKIMTEVFKDKLAMPIKLADGSAPTTLPSPMELKGKVLIKGKRLSSKDAAEEAEEEEEEDEDEEDATSHKLKKEKSVAGEEAEKDKASKKKKPHLKTHPDLSAITYLGTGKVKGFTPETNAAIPADMMASYGENTTYKLAKNADKVEGWIEHNKKHLRFVLSATSFLLHRTFSHL